MKHVFVNIYYKIFFSILCPWFNSCTQFCPTPNALVTFPWCLHCMLKNVQTKNYRRVNFFDLWAELVSIWRGLCWKLGLRGGYHRSRSALHGIAPNMLIGYHVRVQMSYYVHMWSFAPISRVPRQGDMHRGLECPRCIGPFDTVNQYGLK